MHYFSNFATTLKVHECFNINIKSFYLKFNYCEMSVFTLIECVTEVK